MITHVSLDLETLDTCGRATILAIAGVAVTEQDGEFTLSHPHFYRVCNIESQDKRTMSQSTVNWWERQSEEARRVFDEAKTARHPAHALLEFRDWIGNLPGDVQVWGNGSVFDIGILADAMWEWGITEPWDFRNIRDLRTLADIARRYGFSTVLPDVGTHHNALDDALYQANYLAAYFNHLNRVTRHER